MMNRRGMVRARSHWRPRQRVAHQPTGERPPPDDHRARRRHWRLVVVILTLAVGAYLLSSPGAEPAPTGSPAGWVRTYMAWSTRSPQRVCMQLLTPTLRRLFAQAHGSCVGAYRGLKSTPYRVTRVLQTGDAAAIELQWLPSGGYSTFILAPQDGLWRALDMVPGGHLPPHES